MKNNKHKLLKYCIGILVIIFVVIVCGYWLKIYIPEQKEAFQTTSITPLPTEPITGLAMQLIDLTKTKLLLFNTITLNTIALVNINNVVGSLTPTSCVIWNAKYDSKLNTTLNNYINGLISPKKDILFRTCNNPYIYTLDSIPECTMLHAGLLKSGSNASNVIVTILPNYNGQTYYTTTKKYGVQNYSYDKPWRCYSFYSIDGYVIHELMGKYDGNDSVFNKIIKLTIKGDNTFKETDSNWGLQRVWGGGGEGYYTLDSYVPRAAVHAGIIDNGEVKEVEIMLMGKKNNKFVGESAIFPSSTNKNITTLSYDKAYYSFKFIKTIQTTTTAIQTTSTIAPIQTTTTMEPIQTTTRTTSTTVPTITNQVMFTTSENLPSTTLPVITIPEETTALIVESAEPEQHGLSIITNTIPQTTKSMMQLQTSNIYVPTTTMSPINATTGLLIKIP